MDESSSSSSAESGRPSTGEAANVPRVTPAVTCSRTRSENNNDNAATADSHGGLNGRAVTVMKQLVNYPSPNTGTISHELDNVLPVEHAYATSAGNGYSVEQPADVPG